MCPSNKISLLITLTRDIFIYISSSAWIRLEINVIIYPADMKFQYCFYYIEVFDCDKIFIYTAMMPSVKQKWNESETVRL